MSGVEEPDIYACRSSLARRFVRRGHSVGSCDGVWIAACASNGPAQKFGLIHSGDDTLAALGHPRLARGGRIGLDDGLNLRLTLDENGGGDRWIDRRCTLDALERRQRLLRRPV